MFTIISTIIMSALALIWRTDHPINILCKFSMAGMAVWGIVLIAQGAA